ncbi:MAG: SUMF1/EgtB/PvdO family nonheme iron enzyme [gamma proteobacterium symbiont of Lucinoma myriamae]|nr:SUMF1/EgtB/PvdO family nonheme iron enzyme [gamma proteobacterium symbiont of Lucinoma myriamae]MCU7819410.1 SUMF1/EgtB/PvdO family nonheme iron enzyme [gamma proteobacterium symbiont of Lucinoma myriamae]MCU7832964.1 SUMF1/EgtB/PvdO family nonheme iron enzyme [gamma proteobacterium symbiont of Lucinoma myriamae]
MIGYSIKPEADTISLKGFLPTLKIDQRYIMLSGKYILEAEKAGYKTLNTTIDINAENNEFSFTMKETPGIVQLDIVPEKNNEVFIDDVLLAQTNEEMDLHQYEVDKGVHNLRIINPRYKAYEQKIKVEGKNLQQKYRIKLEENWGIAKLESLQKDTKIIITSASDNKKAVYDNVINGVTEIELISGQYTIHAAKEKFKDKKEQVIIKAGDKLNLKPFNLESEDGILHLSSIPSQGIIRVNEQYFGKTPKTVKLSPYQEHTIELSLQGFETTKKTVKLEPEISIKEEFKLTAKKGLVFISVSPKHADLYIDGKKQKENSGKFSLTNKNHLLKVQAKGYQIQSKNISINSYSKNISFILKKNSKKKLSTSVTKTINKKQKQQIRSQKNKDYRNMINQNMILIRPALFKMGSRKNEAGRSSNESEHKVQLNYVYYLSEKEISNKQYRQFKKSHNSGSANNESLNLDNQPVVNVSWQDAARFANWLSGQESIELYYKEENGKMLPVDINADNKGYRLPFEAEWVLAARGKNQKKYAWNGNYPPKNGSGNFADNSASTHVSNTISGYNDQQSVSAPIGSYVKNEMGFYDLGGNVSEWCQDYYSPTSGKSGSKVSLNPKGPKKGTHKVVRDASWRDASITELRLSYRSYSKKKANDIGFRLARYAQ